MEGKNLENIIQKQRERLLEQQDKQTTKRSLSYKEIMDGGHNQVKLFDMYRNSKWKQHIDFNRNVLIGKVGGAVTAMIAAESFGGSAGGSSLAAVLGEPIGYNLTFVPLQYFSKKKDHEGEGSSSKKAFWDTAKIYALGFLGVPVFSAVFFGMNYLLQTYVIDQQWLSTMISYTSALVPAQAVTTVASHYAGALNKKGEEPKKLKKFWKPDYNLADKLDMPKHVRF